MRRSTLLFLTLCFGSVLLAEADSGALTVTPSGGVFAVAFAGDEVLHAAGPSAQLEVGYKFSNGFRLGLRGGAGAAFDGHKFLPIPQFGAVFEVPLGESMSVGGSLLVLPEVLVRLGNHRLGLGLLPLYTTSGGDTSLSLEYGYTFEVAP